MEYQHYLRLLMQLESHLMIGMREARRHDDPILGATLSRARVSVSSRIARANREALEIPGQLELIDHRSGRQHDRDPAA